jgi:NADP-dependent 3-hydroxy acid dehydrogenase YdfG
LIPEYKMAIVVGASSGVGSEIVALLAQQGCRVAAVARREDRLQALAEQYPKNVLPFVHDVRDTAAIPALFQEIARQLGGLDLIVYASGVMPEVGFQEFDFEKDRQMVEVNLLGCIAWLNEAASRMQQTKHGCILAIGSRAGERGLGSMPVYASTKAAVATYMEALRNRVGSLGVRVVTVKPGPIDTEMTASLNLKGMMPAQAAAERILELSARNGELYMKFSDRVICAILRAVPSPILRRLKK